MYTNKLFFAIDTGKGDLNLPANSLNNKAPTTTSICKANANSDLGAYENRLPRRLCTLHLIVKKKSRLIAINRRFFDLAL